jgi:hypothetical protein
LEWQTVIFFKQDMLQHYAENDTVLSLMEAAATKGDDRFTSNRWLKESLPKRLIFYHMYGDLLEGSSFSKKILDIGGGFTSLTRMMMARHDYRLLDIMAHDDHGWVLDVEKTSGNAFWINDDWYNWKPDREYDVVVANDLFPNVDQRLPMFLDKYLPFAVEVRVSLTFYNIPRWYQVRRTDGDEIFHMMATSGEQTAKILESYKPFIREPHLEELSVDHTSLFPNGRQVCMTIFKGEKAS